MEAAILLGLLLGLLLLGLLMLGLLLLGSRLLLQLPRPGAAPVAAEAGWDCDVARPRPGAAAAVAAKAGWDCDSAAMLGLRLRLLSLGCGCERPHHRAAT